MKQRSWSINSSPVGVEMEYSFGGWTIGHREVLGKRFWICWDTSHWMVRWGWSCNCSSCLLHKGRPQRHYRFNAVAETNVSTCSRTCALKVDGKTDDRTGTLGGEKSAFRGEQSVHVKSRPSTFKVEAVDASVDVHIGTLDGLLEASLVKSNFWGSNGKILHFWNLSLITSGIELVSGDVKYFGKIPLIDDHRCQVAKSSTDHYLTFL